MKRSYLLLAACACCMLSTAYAHERAKVKKVTGYVSHGINVYNNQFIADYSTVSPKVSWLNPNEPVLEIGVFAPGEANAAPITEATPRNKPVATIDKFVEFFNPGGVYDRSLLNKTLDQIGTSFFGFSSLDKRAPIIPFGASKPGDLYRIAKANPRPTVRDWDKISGQVSIRCERNGTARVKVIIHNAFPNGLYTLWDVGALNPLTDQEQGYGIPLGGLPNVLLTNENGCGTKEVKVNYCPTEICRPGSKSCSSYISAFYHWDGQVYGGSPAASFAGAPEGIYAANHMVWPMTGIPLMEPVNAFNEGRQNCDKK